MKRSSGVLLNISSLPGPFGIGVFGKEAMFFADKISEMGFSYWQILPLGTLDSGNSPYAGDSAYAGNTYYIDPRKVSEMGLASSEDVEKCIYGGTPYTADFEFVKKSRGEFLKNAYNNFTANKEKFADISKELKAFVSKNKWVKKYGEYRALKIANNNVSWQDFTVKKYNKSDAEFEIFCQFLFFKQWKEIKDYANSKGIKIIGDMPLYVALDCCDVWSETEEFQIDLDTKKPEKVAGVPPDYFSEDGQLWGNPLYNWEKMEKGGFDWWNRRVKFAMQLYDVLRIDHFRGMASYWAVPAGAKSAKEGSWMEGPGQKLFDAIKPSYRGGEIVAEDLGVFGDDVVSLLNTTGFPGMKVIQFAFDGSKNNSHIPHNYDKNCVAYLGTHDNNTLLGWLWEAKDYERKSALDYCGFKGENWGDGGYYSASCRAIIETVWKSTANLAIIAFQDMCGFGSDARMNIPGVAKLNWRFRTTEETINGVDADYFKKINGLFERN